jgi:hypothetical protein
MKTILHTANSLKQELIRLEIGLFGSLPKFSLSKKSLK